MKYFKLNQTVYNRKYGKGIVIGVENTTPYPIKVEFKSTTISFTEDGREYERQHISLSQNPIPEIVNKPIEEDTYKPFTLEDDLLGMLVISKDKSCKGIVTYQDNEKVIIGAYNITYEELLNNYVIWNG
jgi:hypothetical protein